MIEVLSDGHSAAKASRPVSWRDEGPVDMNNAEWGEKLKQAHAKRTGERRRIRLPADTHIRFGGDEECVTVHLTEKAVTSNMQTNHAAFEGWSLALMTWCGVRRVDLDWKGPAASERRHNNGHYQRFLYRAARFAELMDDKVSLRTPEALMDLRVLLSAIAIAATVLFWINQ